MNDTASRERYNQLKVSYPELFTSKDNAAIAIITEDSAIDAAELHARERLDRLGLPQSWATVGVVAEDEYIIFLRDAVRFPSGKVGTYIRLLPSEKSGKGVAVLPMLGPNIILVQHYRHASLTWHLEIPRGFGKRECTDEENAHRELIEELGVRAQKLVKLGIVFPDTGLFAGSVAVFLAYIDSLATLDREEGIASSHIMTADEFCSAVRHNEITDSFTLCALAMAREQGFF